MQDGGRVPAHDLDVEPLRARGRGRLFRRRGERLDEHDLRTGRGEPEPDRSRAGVEIEHARPRRVRPARARRRDADRSGQERVHALRLPAMRLHEGAERREVHRRPDAVGRVIDPREDRRLDPEDLRRVAHVEVRGDADDFGDGIQELAGGAPEGRQVRAGARSIDDERHERLRGEALAGIALDLAQIHRAQRAATRRVEGRQRTAVAFGGPDPIAQGGCDRDEHGREHPAARDVDHVVSAPLGEQPNRGAGCDDELGPGPVADNRVRWRDRSDRRGDRRRERGVTGDGGCDPRVLARELLVVRESEEGAAAAAVGVIAGDALGHRGGRRRT